MKAQKFIALNDQEALMPIEGLEILGEEMLFVVGGTGENDTEKQLTLQGGTGCGCGCRNGSGCGCGCGC